MFPNPSEAERRGKARGAKREEDIRGGREVVARDNERSEGETK